MGQKDETGQNEQARICQVGLGLNLILRYFIGQSSAWPGPLLHSYISLPVCVTKEVCLSLKSYSEPLNHRTSFTKCFQIYQQVQSFFLKAQNRIIQMGHGIIAPMS